jgi:hypothetical protein
MVRLPLVSLLLALTSAAAISKPLDVTVDQLVAAPKQFNGKRVSVIGYFDTTVHHGCDLRRDASNPTTRDGVSTLWSLRMACRW